MRDVLLEIRNLTKIFRSGKKEIIANNNVSFNVYEEEKFWEYWDLTVQGKLL
jgi:ABC-type oligopeptide transport system ATPase subunit